MDDNRQALLKQLPKIDELMLLLSKTGGVDGTSPEIVKTLCRSEVERLRQSILNLKGPWEGPLPTAASVVEEVTKKVRSLRRYRLRRVINGTGVILHTNLGRAPLCSEAVERIVEVSRGYSNLEFDLAKGERGLRYDHIKELLCLLTGAEDGLVVNNNAAAVLLVLNTLSQGREAIVSRGELVEIGGEFRIPDVMEKSGGRLREVGTTNRTRLKDYEAAIGPETALIMKVHTSNFRIIGFTEEAGLVDLVALGRRCGIPVMDDLGSGCFIDLAPYGLEREPTVPEVVAGGVDVVTFSGDKLLGGPQAGLIVGRHDLIEQIRKNPLNRALRIDKLTLAALEATLMQYLDPQRSRVKIPVTKVLTEAASDVAKRAKKLMNTLKKLPGERLSVSTVPGFSMAGGGSLPGQTIPTTLVRLGVQELSSATLESRLRGLD
ncbi:MAG: L-seryl-tRNA(Sec) selenium transferase, partial [Syntrophales bacterium]|nr:L-seryl-tRNA(Sec) selenium transferase [Syntrophales bacterium]